MFEGARVRHEGIMKGDIPYSALHTSTTKVSGRVQRRSS